MIENGAPPETLSSRQNLSTNKAFWRALNWVFKAIALYLASYAAHLHRVQPGYHCTRVRGCSAEKVFAKIYEGDLKVIAIIAAVIIGSWWFTNLFHKSLANNAPEAFAMIKKPPPKDDFRELFGSLMLCGGLILLILFIKANG